MNAHLERSPRGPVALTAKEAALVGVLDALLTSTPNLTLPTQGIRMPSLRPEVMRAGATRMARAALRFLVHGGGHRERVVLREGQRVRGRLWDRALNEGFVLRFSEAARALWLNAAESLPALARLTVEQEELPRQARRMIRDMIPAARESGDHLMYALAARRLAEVIQDPWIRGAVVRRLCRSSGLVLLLRQDPVESRPETEALLAPLVQGPAIRILECLEPELESAFRTPVTLSLLSRTPREALLARLGSITHVLHGFLSQLAAARRLDLASPVAIAAADVLALEPDDVDFAIADNRTLEGRLHRNEVTAALVRMLEVGVELARHHEEMRDQSYGDDRYSEAQAFVAMLDRVLGENGGTLGAQMTQRIRRLSGIIG